MQVIVCEQQGSPDVLELREVEKPAPRDGEVPVRVCAASVNAHDWHYLTADMFPVRLTGGGLLKPKHSVLGADIAGRVEAVGSKVTQFRAGDYVYGEICHGGFAEYACAPESRLVLKPSSLSFEEAAAVPMAALTALQGSRDEGHTQPGQKVLAQSASVAWGPSLCRSPKRLAHTSPRCAAYTTLSRRACSAPTCSSTHAKISLSVMNGTTSSSRLTDITRYRLTSVR